MSYSLSVHITNNETKIENNFKLKVTKERIMIIL